MIEKIDQVVPVRFSTITPGEYFGVLLDKRDGRPLPATSWVWRCQKLSGPGARFRILFGGKLADLPPAEDGWAVRHMPCDLEVHRYANGNTSPPNEPKFEDYATFDARRFSHSAQDVRGTERGLLKYSTSSVLRRLGQRMTARLRTVPEPELRFVHLCDYAPEYDLHLDPDDSDCHVVALDGGVRALCDTQLESHKLVGKAIRAVPFLSALPEFEPQIFATGAWYRLEDFGLQLADARKALDRLARSDRQYRQLREAAESVLRTFRRMQTPATESPCP